MSRQEISKFTHDQPLLQEHEERKQTERQGWRSCDGCAVLERQVS